MVDAIDYAHRFIFPCVVVVGQVYATAMRDGYAGRYGTPIAKIRSRSVDTAASRPALARGGHARLPFSWVTVDMPAPVAESNSAPLITKEQSASHYDISVLFRGHF